jgi:hypothetical protein
MRTESTTFPKTPVMEASQQRWQQVLAFGCLPNNGGMAKHRQTASPAVPAFDIIP